MKTSLHSIGLTLALLSAHAAIAQQYWDGAGAANDNVVQGGSGIWSELNDNWTTATGSTNSTWLRSRAVFGGLAAGTVTTDGTLRVERMRFTRTGYLIAQGGPGVIESDSLFIEVDPGVTATIDAPIDVFSPSAAYLQKVGPGTLVVTKSISAGVINPIDGAFLLQAGGFAISSGGVVNSTFSNQHPTMTVTGAGTLWHIVNFLTVGEHSVTPGVGATGTLQIQNGGVVENVYAILGHETGSKGLVVVTGAGSKWTNSDDVEIGSAGDGTLLVQAGGLVSSVKGIIGYQPNSTGRATVEGVGSKWSTTEQLVVGFEGTGTLTVRSGGVVSSADDSYVGFQSTSNGAATVDGVGSRLEISSGLYVGLDGPGRLTVINDGLVSATRVHLGSVGTLGGNGRIAGPVENGGVVSPGVSPGTLALEGDYTQQAGGLLRIEIGGTAPALFDHLAVLGNVSLTSGSILEVAFINGFAPKMGDTFDFLTSSGPVSGQFAEVRVTGLQPGFQYSVGANAAGHVALRALNDGVAAPPPNARADLAITKNAQPGSLSAGETLTYTLTIANAGPDAASAVVVRDTLPAAVIYVSGTATNGGAISTAGNAIAVNFPAVAAGASATVTLTTKVNSDVPNNTTLTNTATVSATTADPNPANNTATVTTLVLNPHPLKFYLHANDIPGTAGGYTMNASPAPSQTLGLNLNTAPSWFSEPALNGTFRAGATFRVTITKTAGLSLGATYRLASTNLDGTGEQSLGQVSRTLGTGTDTITIPVNVPVTLTNRRLKLTISSALGLSVNLNMGGATYLEATDFVGTP